MGSRRILHLHGGPKNGKIIHESEPLPKVLVFQGIIDGIFQVIEYVRVNKTLIYRFKEKWNES